MSTVSTIKSKQLNMMKVLCKGAPEVIQGLLRQVPEEYEEYYSFYVKHGYRVIALGHKDLPDGTKPDTLSRESAESNLEFAGFLIFQCPMKEDTFEHITKIKEAEIKIKIITGDNILTAAYVAVKLKIAENFTNKENADTVAFARVENNKTINWLDYDDNLVSKLEIKNMNFFSLEKMSKSIILCMSGAELDTLQELMSGNDMSRLLLNVHVFARTSPVQKDYIVGMLNKLGKYTSM